MMFKYALQRRMLGNLIYEYYALGMEDNFFYYSSALQLYIHCSVKSRFPESLNFALLHGALGITLGLGVISL
jgi:hypothetical protein